jgi:hypothetical protein
MDDDAAQAALEKLRAIFAKYEVSDLLLVFWTLLDSSLVRLSAPQERRRLSYYSLVCFSDAILPKPQVEHSYAERTGRARILCRRPHFNTAFLRTDLKKYEVCRIDA